MKRDMDLIRHILIEVEKGDGKVIQTIPLPDGITEEMFAYQVALMRDAGLLEAHIHGTAFQPVLKVTITRMTWFGHDFLQSVRDDTLWAKAKDSVLKPAASWSFSLLVEWLKVEIHQRFFGVPPSS
ncbi:MAG TPA: DUF2513 domain-containing protein [Sedimentisphaerales bacterium]